MALKNLYDMVKADRYTADGREAIIKAQEAETEDKVYQIGEISQKTGLQKTANGWVKPKSVKQAGAKKQEEPKNVHGAEVDAIYERQLKRIKELKAKGFTDEQIDNDKIIKQTKEDMRNVGKKPEASTHPPKVMPKGMSPAAFEKAWEDDAKKHGFEKGQGYEWREYLRKEEEEGETSAKAFADKVHKGEIKYNEETGKFEERKTAESKPAGNQEFIKIPTAKGYAKVPKEVYSKYADNKKEVRLGDYIDRKMAGKPMSENNKFYEFVKNKIYESGEDPAPYLGQGGYSYPQSLIDTYYDEWTSKTSDAAPRVLTGDTRIRVRKA